MNRKMMGVSVLGALVLAGCAHFMGHAARPADPPARAVQVAPAAAPARAVPSAPVRPGKIKTRPASQPQVKKIKPRY